MGALVACLISHCKQNALYPEQHVAYLSRKVLCEEPAFFRGVSSPDSSNEEHLCKHV